MNIKFFYLLKLLNISVMLSSSCIVCSKDNLKELEKFCHSTVIVATSSDSIKIISSPSKMYYNFFAAHFDSVFSSKLFYIVITIDKLGENGYLFQIMTDDKGKDTSLDAICPIVNGKIKGICEVFSFLDEHKLAGICEYSNNLRNGIMLFFSGNCSYLLIENYKKGKLYGRSIRIHNLSEIIYFRNYINGKLKKSLIELYPNRYE